ncbi:MAG: cobalt ECF transporter T component CbiQ [Candidatus Hadarchaeum sp.]|uniref:cobalt ECF transporter T component CbiQ n=1 Tax=Candidatus Hadarchaeum sp. TaxID=2883567 RepID=UPI003D146649
MKHSFIDKYGSLKSPIHRLDPRAKIITLFSFLFIVVFTPITLAPKFLFYGTLLIALILISKVPISFVLKRSLVILPFVGLVAIGLPFMGNGGGSLSLGIFTINQSATLIFLNVLVKSWLCVLAMIALTSTTPFSRLLNGFQRLKMPTVFVMILSFMYRFVFILEDELYRMVRARDARTFKPSWSRSLKTAGNMIGTLFIRSYERGERIYVAMRSRGYQGKIKLTRELKMNGYDISFMTAFLLILVLVAVV